MNRAETLRRRAERLRRLAQVPSNGGRTEDRLLLRMADELIRQAEAIEDRALAGDE